MGFGYRCRYPFFSVILFFLPPSAFKCVVLRYHSYRQDMVTLALTSHDDDFHRTRSQFSLYLNEENEVRDSREIP